MPFKKGNNANPKGRPKTGTSIAEAIRRLGGEDGGVYVTELHSMATTHEDPRVKLMAMGLLLDRGFGKPPQDVTLKGTLDTVTTVVHKHG